MSSFPIEVEYNFFFQFFFYSEGRKVQRNKIIFEIREHEKNLQSKIFNSKNISTLYSILHKTKIGAQSSTYIFLKRNYPS